MSKESVSEQQQRRKRGRYILIALICLFGLPYLASFVLIRTPGLIDLNTRNYGVLLKPNAISRIEFKRHANELTEVGDFTGKWTLLLIGGRECQDQCLSSLYTMRQVRKALGVERASLRNAYINVAGNFSPALSREMQSNFPATQRLEADARAVEQLADMMGMDRTQILHRMLVVDPLGNLVLLFNADADPRGMLADLEILLSTEISEQAP